MYTILKFHTPMEKREDLKGEGMQDQRQFPSLTYG